MPLDKALKFLHEKRPVINPTEKFKKELIELNKKKQLDILIKTPKKKIVDSIIEPSPLILDNLDE